MLSMVMFNICQNCDVRQLQDSKQHIPEISWCQILNLGEERETNKMQLIWCLLSNFYLNMFRASLCPPSGEQECALLHMVFCIGCGCVELGCELCALWKLLFDSQCTQLASQLHTTTASTTSAEHHMQQCTLLFSADGHNDAQNMLR
jgi:hypothetical protein